jgi:hypothetical protein
MLDFSSGKNLIRSLILKALGNPEFKFIEYNEGTIHSDYVEFITDNYKFTAVYNKDKIRVYDNGIVFFLPHNPIEDFFIPIALYQDYLKEFAEKLQDFYKFEVLGDTNQKFRFYKFTKLDTI